MKIKSMDVVPMNPISTFLVFLNAKMHGMTAQTPPSYRMKLVEG